MEWHKDNFTISDDRMRLDVGVIQTFLENDSYWAQTRTIDQTGIAIENSLCFGVYLETRQVGFARVVTDKATFAYLGDVFILEEFRGRGLSKWLMETVVSHPELQGLRRWILATRDAHSLYRKYGFADLMHPDRWMERAAPDAY